MPISKRHKKKWHETRGQPHFIVGERGKKGKERGVEKEDLEVRWLIFFSPLQWGQ